MRPRPPNRKLNFGERGPNMEFATRIECSDSLSRSAFSIRNILNLRDYRNVVDFRSLAEGFDDTACSIPRSIVSTPVPYNPPPLMYPCGSFGLPLYAPLNCWTSIDTGRETLSWTRPNTNFTTHQIFCGFAPFTSLPRRRKHPTKKKKRPLFSQHQVQTMENEFTKHRYITESKRAELSSELDLTETQVKTWFQNRRTKWRKELRVAMTMAQTHQTTQEKMRENSSSSQVELCLDNI